MKLFYMPGSCALSCHIALDWAGADYELERLSHDDLSSDAFLSVNPKAKVPALRLDDKTIVTEALAVLSHIAHEHASVDGMLPPAGVPRALMLEALSELTGEFHPAFFPLHVPSRYTEDEAGHDSVKAAARSRARHHYDRWNDRMADSDWVLSSGRSVVDPYLYVMCRWSGMIDAEIGEWEALARFADHMEAQRGTLEALRAEGLDPLLADRDADAA